VRGRRSNQPEYLSDGRRAARSDGVRTSRSAWSGQEVHLHDLDGFYGTVLAVPGLVDATAVAEIRARRQQLDLLRRPTGRAHRETTIANVKPSKSVREEWRSKG
jgi:hypothetical protein